MCSRCRNTSVGRRYLIASTYILRAKHRTDNLVEADDWRCKDCVTHDLRDLGTALKNVPELLSTRRSSAPKMARDLLPNARGIKPGSYSMYNTLIMEEDPLDGSRALRKRKTPSADDDEPPRNGSRKRQRTDEIGEANGSRKRQRTDELGDANGARKSQRPEDIVEEAPGDMDVDEAHAAVVGLDGADDGGSPRSRSARSQRNPKYQKRAARIVSRSNEPRSVVVAISVTATQWENVEKEVQKKQKRRERDRLRRLRNNTQRPATATVEPEEPPEHFPAVQTTTYTNPFYAFPDRETDETKGKPYGGILTDAEADTTRTYPNDADRQAFQNARERAEQQWKDKLAQSNGGETASARNKAAAPASKIKCINFGQFEIDTWHAAPYPEEYSRNKHLYICEFCLKYMSSDYVAWRHKLKCSAKHPPGDEIYRSRVTNPETGAETTLSFFEVDGRRNPLYCQNLCLLAKLFLGSKTLYYDVEPFLFYIMTENDEFGCHFVGYFSKEKRGCGPPPPMSPHKSFDEELDDQANGGADATATVATDTAVDSVLSSPGNNVSCILVLPVHMRRGFGRVLIEFSYLLTKVEGRTGSPEKPLSDMGLVSYRSYWRNVLCVLLLRYKDVASASEVPSQLSIVQIARETGMTADDIISTLEALRFLVRDPVTKTYALRIDYEYAREYADKHAAKANIQLDPERLCWTPYVMGRPTNLFAMGEEATRPLQTVAPREEEVADEVEVLENGAQLPVKTKEDDVQAEATTTTEQQDPILADSTRLTPGTRQKTPVALTPQPSNLSDRQLSPSRRSPRKTPNGTRAATRSVSPGSYYSAATSQQPAQASSAAIPPTRFEIYPPVPGLASAKRKPGRPFNRGSSRRSTYGTPARRSTTSRRPRPSPGPSVGGSLRRTRSTLGDVQLSVNGDGEAGVQATEEAVEDDGEAEGSGEEIKYD